MEWTLVLLLFGCLLVIAVFSGLPVAFSFYAVNLVLLYFLAGGINALFVVVPSASNILLSDSMLAVPIFILMGEILFHSGLSQIILDAIDLWVGRVPGRLGVLAIVLGAIFAALSGSGMACTVLLGSLFVPEMRRRGYSKKMCTGPVMAGGVMAPIMPPTWLAVVLAILARASVGEVVVGAVIPCLILGAAFSAYVIVAAVRNPLEAPKYEVANISWGARLNTIRHIVPTASIIFAVIGTVFMGLATPSEAAGLGAVLMFFVVAIYRLLSWSTIMKTIKATAIISCMSFTIVMGSSLFSQLLAYTGATREMVSAASRLAIPSFFLILLMQLIIFIMGCFLDQVSIIMIAIPMFAPVVSSFGYDLSWFCVATLVNLSLGGITPPFGLFLFAMKGVVPEDFSMGDIIRGSVPYFTIGLCVVVLLLMVPGIILWPLQWMR